MSAERAVTVPLWVMARVSAVESLDCSGSGSSQAASVEVAFFAECLCFANLTLSFLEVLILVLILAGWHINDFIPELCRMQNHY